MVDDLVDQLAALKAVELAVQMEFARVERWAVSRVVAMVD